MPAPSTSSIPAPAPSATARPNFFIVGHSKSGTTALYKFLQAHPDVWMSEPKEPNYFATDFCRGVTEGAYVQRSEPAYLRLYDGWSGQRAVGEASACYLFSEEAAANIARFNPEARIIVMLREPVSFLRSYHLQRLKNPPTEGEDVKDFARALALEPRRKQGLDTPPRCQTPELLYYSERVKYADQLRRYREHFPAEQVLVIIYDDFKADNAATFERVCRFLDIDPTFEPEYEVHNRGKQIRSKTAQQTMRQLTHGEGALAGVKRFAKLLLPRPVRRRLTGLAYNKLVFEPKTHLDDAFVTDLKRRFKPEVERISEVLDRDLVTLWGYDRV